jgi:hypothetical protein
MQAIMLAAYNLLSSLATQIFRQSYNAGGANNDFARSIQRLEFSGFHARCPGGRMLINRALHYKHERAFHDSVPRLWGRNLRAKEQARFRESMR